MTFAATYDDVRAIRATEPERVAKLLAARRRRPFVPADGRLMIVAADHPARGALAAGGRADAMASRPELLDRLRAALARPGVDGVLATCCCSGRSRTRSSCPRSTAAGSPARSSRWTTA